MPFVTCNLIEEFCSQNEKVGKMSRVSSRFRTITANVLGLAKYGYSVLRQARLTAAK